MKSRFLSILLCTLFLITSDAYGISYKFQDNKDTPVTKEQDRISKDSSYIVNIDGKEIRFEGKEAVKVYKTSSKKLAFYLIISIGLMVALVYFSRYSKAKERKKEAAIQTLSDRELMVVQLIQEGKQNKEIAEALFISVSTVKTHINNIYKKLNIKDRNSLKKFRFPAS